MDIAYKEKKINGIVDELIFVANQKTENNEVIHRYISMTTLLKRLEELKSNKKVGLKDE